MIISKSRPLYKFIEDAKIIYFRDLRESERIEILDDNSLDDVESEFVSSERKFFIQFQEDFFHMLVDTLGIILDQFKVNKDMLFVIDSCFFEDIDRKLFNEKEEIFQMLDNAGVKYVIANSLNKIRINNFYFLNPREPEQYPSLNKFYAIREAAYNTFPENIKEATRNIYVSRSGYVGPRSKRWENNVKDPGILFENDIRMDDELLLEKYFSSLGYEIVYSNDNSSIKDAIEMFSSAKRVISITGATLANCAFMESGGLVVEISVPMGMLFDSGSWHFALHTHYKAISDLLKHTYVSIPTMRKAQDLIDRIESNPTLKNILEVK